MTKSHGHWVECTLPGSRVLSWHLWLPGAQSSIVLTQMRGSSSEYQFVGCNGLAIGDFCALSVEAAQNIAVHKTLARLREVTAAVSRFARSGA